jgi:hypothetical protein
VTVSNRGVDMECSAMFDDSITGFDAPDAATALDDSHEPRRSATH